MPKYRIADLIVEFEPRFEPARSQAEPYRANDDAEPDCRLIVTERGINFELERGIPTPEYAEYTYSRYLFQREALRHKVLTLHSSAVVCDGSAYLFSANSGMGKSTHTRLWLERFGSERAYILNDDAPSMRQVAGVWRAYGTPWAGSTQINVNASAPLKGVAFLERSQTNWIKRINPDEAMGLFMLQSYSPGAKPALVNALDLIVRFLKEVPIYRLGCNMESEAAQVARDAMDAQIA